MEGESYLILNHLVKNNIIKIDSADEVLPVLPRDAASSIAVTVVSSFSPDGSQPSLDTEFKIDWMMQAVAYCLTLPTLYQDSIQNAIKIFEFWLLDKNIFKTNETRNKYAREFIKHMSLVCEVKYDNAHPSYRSQLISELESAWLKCVKRADYFDTETWDVFIKVIIGCADYLFSDYSIEILTENIAKPLVSELFALLFSAIQQSDITEKSTWDIIIKFIKKWMPNEVFITQMCKTIYNQYEALITSMIDEKTLKITTKKPDIKTQKIGFRLSQYLNALDLNVLKSEQRFFTIFSLTLESMTKASQKIIEKSPLLYTPSFPADAFFSLFGKWLFQPFTVCDPSYLKIHVSMLMYISGTWDLYNSKWKPLLLSTLEKAIQMPNPFTTLKNGYLLLSRFLNDDIVDRFLDAIMKSGPSSFVDDMYWILYASLIEDLAEVRTIDESVFKTLFECSKESHALTRVFATLMHQSPQLFMKYSRYSLKHAMNVSSPFLESLITNTNITVASAIPFDNIKIDDYIDDVMSLLMIRKENKKLLSTFLVLIAQVTKWRKDAFSPDFATRFTSFAQEILENNKDENIAVTVHMLCGRSIDTTLLKTSTIHLCEEQKDIDQRLYLKPFFTVMVGDDHLVSLVGDETRKNSFVVHIREPRGFFAWELKDLPAPSTLSVIESPDKLDPPPVATLNTVNVKPCSVEGAVEKMHELAVKYEDYDKKSHHENLPHVAVREKQRMEERGEVVPLRHKFIDFLIQTGLSNKVSMISDPIESVISNFDAIPASAVIKISLYHLSPDNKDDSSPLYTHFKSLLGDLYSFAELKGQQVRAKNYGIAQIAYHESFESDFGIIFSESHMRLNIKSDKIPKKKLLFVVQPLKPGFYRVATFTTVTVFSWGSPVYRVVRFENIGRAISSVIFAFVATQDTDTLFQPNQERAKYLRSIQKVHEKELSLAERLPPKLVN